MGDHDLKLKKMPLFARKPVNINVVELLMSQKTLPWPLLVNQDFYIPKCLLSCVDFKNGSCHFFSFLRSRSKVKGHCFRIYGITYYVTVFGSFSVKRSPKPGYIERRYITATFNAIFK